MFRSRSNDEKTTAGKAAADDRGPRHPEAPKGRPTPKRSQAQTQRRSVARTPTNRKEAAKRQRETRREAMERQRQAMASGDERYLPARDKGPVRRFTRDFVDSRISAAEYFLPFAVVILVLSLVRIGALQSVVLLLWLLLIVVIVIDFFGIAIRLRRKLTERFPNESHRGAVGYALMRSLQMRRLRLPKPQVSRGERP